MKKQARWHFIDQSFLSLFITFSLVELTNRGSSIVDGLFVSNFLGPQAMAAMGIAKPIYAILGVVGGFFFVGMQSKCSIELGKGNREVVNRFFSGLFYLSAILSFLMGTAVFLFAKPMVALLGASNNGASLSEDAANYLRGIGIGVPSILLAVMLSIACQLDSAKARVRKAGALNFVFNCLLDYAAIKFGFGVFGVALSTSVARYLQVGYLLLHFRSPDRMLHFSKFDLSVKETVSALRLGTERSLRSLGQFVAPLIVNRIVLQIGGANAMSALSIQGDLKDFVEIFAIGLADTTAFMAGIYYGEQNEEKMLAMGKSAHKVCFTVLCSIGTAMAILSKPLAGVYGLKSGELFDMAVYVFMIVGLCAPVNGLARARISYLNAVKRIRSMQIMTVLSTVVYTILTAWFWGACFKVYGALSAELSRMILLLFTVWAYHAIRKRKLLPTPKDYLALPENFEPDPGDVISLDIRNCEDISLAAEQLQLFCKGHKLDQRIGVRASICLEELAVNIMKFGFPKCKKQPVIDLRVVSRGNELIIRLLDNCPAFDVEQKMHQMLCDPDLFNAEAEGSGTGEGGGKGRLGLLLLSKLAESVRYTHSLDMNTVILRFHLDFVPNLTSEREKGEIG